jgi:hypothetical protein
MHQSQRIFHADLTRYLPPIRVTGANLVLEYVGLAILVLRETISSGLLSFCLLNSRFSIKRARSVCRALLSSRHDDLFPFIAIMSQILHDSRALFTERAFSISCSPVPYFGQVDKTIISHPL